MASSNRSRGLLRPVRVLKYQKVLKEGPCPSGGFGLA